MYKQSAMFRPNSLAIKLWRYFIIFASVIFIVLWLLQTLLLPLFYESMKLSGLKAAAEEISSNYGLLDSQRKIAQAALHYSTLILFVDNFGNIVYGWDEHKILTTDALENRPNRQTYFKLRELLERNPDEAAYMTEVNSVNQGRNLIYALMLDENYMLLMSTSVEPENSTTDIIRTQLLIVTIFSLVFSFILSFFLARRIASPITVLTSQAARMPKGDFEKAAATGFCEELDELSETLNETAEELSRIEQLRRDLLANVSHDLRTPLTMIKAYAELIHDISGDNRTKREEHLRVIEKEADHLNLLVNDILDVSVLQSGGRKILLSDINLSEKVLSAVNQFMPFCEKEGYILIHSIEDNQHVSADPTMITQILYNLIANALNYIGDDKTILVTLSARESSTRFEVSDHGAGIAPEEIENIWERYYQAKKRRSKVGTGLGLSIVKEILDLHKARYGVLSEPGAGSTFWFELDK